MANLEDNKFAQNRSSFVNKCLKAGQFDKGNHIYTHYIVVLATNIPQGYAAICFLDVAK